MIDTINLNIYNLEKYEPIINFLEHTQTKNATTFLQKVDEETGEVLENKKGAAVFFHNRDSFLFRTTRDFINSPSSAYRPVFTINRLVSPARLEFNLSIPKYVYGSNILQFINYYDTMSAATFEKLLQFIEEFRKSTFIQVIDKEDIEIARIDFCYNQYFLNKENSLNYLEEQKIVLSKMAKGGGQPSYFPTSLFIKYDAYSFKIYHKGTEFKKGDYNELCKGGHKLDVQMLQQIADRNLRYETSYRRKYFNEIYQSFYNNHKSKKAKKSSIHYKLNVQLKLNSDSKFQRKFMLCSDYDNWKTYKNLDKTKYQNEWYMRFQHNKYVTFDFYLFNELYNKFWQQVKKFQITSINDVSGLRSKLNALNQDIILRNKVFGKKEKVQDVQRLVFWVKQSQKQSLKKYVTDGDLSEAQYYRILKKFRELDLSDYNPNVRMPQPNLEYTDYKYYFGAYH